MGSCATRPRGRLAWIDNDRLLELNLWPGDRRFLPWVFEERAFSAKFRYQEGRFLGYEATFYGRDGRIERETYRHQETPGRPTRLPRDRSADDNECWLCGGPVDKRHCKIICLVCGFTRDCSDP